jgi:putative endonuclease
MGQQKFYVYIMATAGHKVLYIDVTSDLVQRVAQHKTGTFGGFTQNYSLHTLLYYEIWDSSEAATQRAQQLKRWHRQWKLNLIRELNPTLEDLPMS